MKDPIQCMFSCCYIARYLKNSTFYSGEEGQNRSQKAERPEGLRSLTRVLDTSPNPPPQLSGRILVAPPDAPVIFSHNYLPCNARALIVGRITYWGGGGHKRKRSKLFNHHGYLCIR